MNLVENEFYHHLDVGDIFPRRVLIKNIIQSQRNISIESVTSYQSNNNIPNRFEIYWDFRPIHSIIVHIPIELFSSVTFGNQTMSSTPSPPLPPTPTIESEPSSESTKPKRLPRSAKKRLRYERLRQQRKEAPKKKKKKKTHTSSTPSESTVFFPLSMGNFLPTSLSNSCH